MCEQASRNLYWDQWAEAPDTSLRGSLGILMTTSLIILEMCCHNHQAYRVLNET